MRIESWAGIVLVASMLCGAVLFADPERACASSSLPSNIEVPADLRPLMQRIYQRSVTFRKQCQKIGEAKDLQITVVRDLSIPRYCRAFTNVRRTPAVLHAEVHVRPGVLLVELLAHEFEHILEQLDGLDMRALSRTRGSGVREIFFEVFESERAQRAGEIVAREEQTRSIAD